MSGAVPGPDDDLPEALRAVMAEEAVKLDRLYSRIPPGRRVADCEEAFARIAREAARLAREWQPIETAEPQTPVLLFTPASALYEKPRGRGDDVRVAAPQLWTWATHWMPRPQPPVEARTGSAR